MIIGKAGGHHYERKIIEFLMGRRSTNERRKYIRETPDRREMVEVKLAIYSPTDSVEFWLQKNCTQDYELALIDVSDDLEQRDIEVMFRSTVDRDSFSANAAQF